VNENPFTYGLGNDGGGGSWVNTAAGVLSLVIAIGGSMLWVRWRERRGKRPKA
jgi:hypothetical protein